MTLEHRFRISSATKLFVAAVVLQLVDEGALALDGEVSLIDGGMTVRQLLTSLNVCQPGFVEDAMSREPAKQT